jgi:hypothetical protein
MEIVRMRKILPILMGFLIVILTSGCGQVIYRVKPDSPPKMGIQEARETLELSLSLAQLPPGSESVALQGDELVLFNSTIGPILSHRYTASYYDISKEVGKHGNNYSVSVNFTYIRGYKRETIYWKSKDDAMSFVDAAYSLRPVRFQEKIAALPTLPSQKDVPGEVPEPKKVTQQRESTTPDSEKGKPISPLPPESASAKSPPMILEDKTPPKITITSPDVTDSLTIAARESRITVAGVVESKIGISEISVNGLLAKLQDKGNFSADVPLKAGPNDIVITAFDSQRNKTSQQFIVYREDIKPDLAKKEAPTAVADIKPMQAPTIPVEEKTPPKILIISPDVTHDRSLIAKGNNITFAGTVESKIGLSDVLINGQPVSVDEKGNFSENILLKIGRNNVTVTAIDIRKNQVTRDFIVDRERVQVAKVSQSDAIVPKILISSPDVTHDRPVISEGSSMTVAGTVESKIGLVDVLINGNPVNVDEKGNFSENIFLKIGKNDITIMAIDIRKNQVIKQFVVNRERFLIAKGSQTDASIPKIVIISPDVTRAVSVVANKPNITIIGKAESKIGIAYVLINGQHADIDENGNFSIDVFLKAGKNDITVTAMDVHKNQVTKQFDVNREAGKVALVKKEEPVPETGLMSGKHHALLIAVQDYSNPEIGKLDYPVSDARQLMDVLGSRYTFDKENITLLYNPDRRTIYKTLQSMRKQLKEKDSLLIFYAGHGMWLDDMKQGFWLPSDATGLNDPSDWIPNSSIRDYIKAIKAKHILLVADACFSGGIFKLRDSTSSPGTSMEKIYEQPSRKAMTSGSLKTVPDQSVFVEFLIKRLEENKDPYLDAHKLFSRMREAVIHNSKVKQTPLYGAINEAGDEGGDFIFIKRQ